MAGNLRSVIWCHDDVRGLLLWHRQQRPLPCALALCPVCEVATMMFDEDGMVLASEGLVVPHPWEVRKSATYLGMDILEVL